MFQPLRYDPTAALQTIRRKHWKSLIPEVESARDEAFADVELLFSGDSIPKKKQPLDSGFISLPASLLEEHGNEGESSLLGQIQTAAEMLREELDRFVFLGIGGSYMGAKALFEALCRPYHNELGLTERAGIPRVYFEGNNFDNDTISSLLDLLKTQCSDKADFRQRWGMAVISKSGGTLETAASFRLFRDALENYYGANSEESRKYVVPITGEQGKLRELSTAAEYSRVFPIPDGVGGRFSIFTAVGLFPAAMMGINLSQLLQGAADMTERCRTAPAGDNPVLDYVAVCRLMETEQGRNIRVLSTWGARLESFGFWYDQLLSESLGKKGKGATPLTAVNTRDLHSRGQQHQEGAEDKLITNVIVEKPSRPPLEIPNSPHDHDQLNRLAGKKMPDLLSAAIRGTNRAYAEVERPTADLILPQLDAYAIGQLLQMLMLATVVEGRLIGINPYGQPGVEAYKKNMGEILYGQ